MKSSGVNWTSDTTDSLASGRCIDNQYLSGSTSCSNCSTNCSACVTDKLCLSCANNLNVIFGSNDSDLICSSNTTCSNN